MVVSVRLADRAHIWPPVTRMLISLVTCQTVELVVD